MIIELKEVIAINVNFAQYFDRVNGNTYRAFTVNIEFKEKSPINLVAPFGYGYGDFYSEFRRFHKGFNDYEKGYQFRNLLNIHERKTSKRECERFSIHLRNRDFINLESLGKDIKFI